MQQITPTYLPGDRVEFYGEVLEITGATAEMA